MSWLKGAKENIILIAIISIYIIVNMILTLNEFYYLNLLPIVFIIVIFAFLKLDILYLIVIFFTPLSISLIAYFPESPIDFAIPTEPIIFGIMLIFIYKLVQEGKFDRRIINHPVSYAILFHLGWLFLTSVTSCMPLVSFKFLLARLWFLITFYLLAIQVFRNTKFINYFIWCYVAGMSIVVIYAIYRHLGIGLFDKDASHSVMGPFFRDHTSYGAILAMLFYAMGGIIVGKKQNFFLQIFNITALVIIVSGLILSYTRAAWISVLLASGVLAVTILKIRLKYLVLFGGLILYLFLNQRVEISYRLKKNKQDSSADIAEHAKSISNITTDDSNLERLNRWNAALRMFRERPIFGWGPGTYKFKYAPFQLSKNKTLISTDFGNLGNAHSEYIGPLSESGVFGCLSFVLIAFFSLLTGYKVYFRIHDKYHKRIVLALILGLITYLAHGFLNNFLDTDKASALFWGYIAVFVSLDIYYAPSQENNLPDL